MFIPSGPTTIAGDATASTAALMLDIVRSLVSEPSLTTLEVAAKEDITVLLLNVCKQDLGRVIGKQGRTAQSLRLILQQIEIKTRQRFQLDIREDVSSAPHV
jgi:predicted RNA-binding protein YlqC (UPF0109 family)